MTAWLPVCAILLFPVLGVSVVGAMELSRYRGLQLGASLETTAKQADLKSAEVRDVHRRPALIQELEWRLGSAYPAAAVKADPVRDSLLRFYNGRLYQIVTTYDRDRIEGLSTADMVAAVSAVYGVAARPQTDVAYHTNYGETAAVLARWEDPEYSHSLVRTGDQTSYALILTFKPLDALARTAVAESVRLDALEAPQRALDLLKKSEADGRQVLSKARAVNLPNFRP